VSLPEITEAITNAKNTEVTKINIGCSRDQRMSGAQLYPSQRTVFGRGGVEVGAVNLLHFGQNPLA
jgi:hypothetical protein